MKKSLFLLLLLPALSWGTQWVWDGGHATSGKWSEATNWTADASYPQAATDTVLLNNTSVDPCTLDVSPSIAQFTIASNYSGFFVMTGQTMICAYDFSNDGITNAHNFGNGITWSTTLHIGSGVSSVTATSCVFTGIGAEVIVDDDRGIAPNSLLLGANAVITNTGSATTTYRSANPIYFTNGGSLIFTTRANFRLNAIGSFIIIAAGTPTITINSPTAVGFGFDANNLTGIIPAITINGSSAVGLGLFVGTSTGCTYNQTGTITCSVPLVINGNSSVAGSTFTYNTNNNNIIAGVFDIGSNQANSIITFNAGSSTISTTIFGSAGLNSSANILNLQTSQWLWSGVTWAFCSAAIINSGTSIVTANGTTGQTVTSNGKSFYDLTILNTGTAFVTLADSVTCHDLTVSDGLLKTTNGISCDDFIVSPADSCNVKIVRLTGDYYRGASASKMDTAGQHIYLAAGTSHTVTSSGQQHGQVTIAGPMATVGNLVTRVLTWASNGLKWTLTAGTTSTITTVSGLGGAAGALDSLVSGTPGSIATINLGGATVTAPYLYAKDITVTNGSIVATTGGVNGGNTSGITWPSTGGGRRGGSLGLMRGLWLGL